MTNQELRQLTTEAVNVAEEAFKDRLSPVYKGEDITRIAVALIELSSRNKEFAEALEKK